MKVHERILFVADARLIYRGTTMENPSKHEAKPGLNLKKIVVTTNKLYVFRTLANDIEDIEFRLQNKKPAIQMADDKTVKEFTSVAGEPENEIEIQEKYGKVVLEEEPSIHEFIKKLNIFTSHRPIKNSVLLLSPLNRTIEMIFFDRLKEAFRFAKSITCANAWMRYVEQCQLKKVRPNYRWASFLQDIIYDEEALVVVDPFDFNDQNEEEEITCFIELLDRTTYINRLQLKFKIRNEYGYLCANRFLGISALGGLRVLQLTDCTLIDEGVEQLQAVMLRLSSLVELNFSRNNLTDVCLATFTKLLVQCPELCRLKLQKNQLQLAKPNHQMLLVDLLRSSLQLLTLDLSENKMEDSAVEIIERAVVFAQNPPLREIDLSSNLFTNYGSWRLFKGNLVMIKNHEYMVFILYPIPFSLEIFTDGFQDFPVKKQPLYRPSGNLPLSLSQQLIEETNTLTSLTLSENNSTGLVIRRKIYSGKPLPKSHDDVASMSQVKGRLSKLISNKNTKLEDILKQCQEISRQKFGYPSSVLEEITYYLWEKLNQALLIRDHESIGMLKHAANLINVDLNPYRQRLAKVEKRKQIYATKLRQIYNFELNQFDINRELDEMVKEGLRLSLKGKALNFLFYLKDLRDKKIRQLIELNYNPIVELEELKTRNYATFFDVSADSHIEWEVPYELQQQKDINQNLYLFHLQADYDVLARLDPQEYHRMELHLRSVKLVHEKFIRYLRLAEERLKFIINEYYQTFSFNTFKISFVELKINACRHLWQYRNVRRTMAFFSLPAYIRKMPVSPEKCIVIGNKQEFQHRYAVENYPNIREEVWRDGVYGYRGSITKYSGVDFENECKEVCMLTDAFIRELCALKDRITEEVLPIVFKIAHLVRNALYPEELLEEFYLHLICMQEESNKNTELLVGFMPFLTMYLKPPPTVEKTLLAFLARNDFAFSYMPMSMEYQSDLEVSNDRMFVERDWLPKNKYAMQLINRFGKVTVRLHTPLKTSFTVEISEVENVGDLMYQVYLNEYLSPFYDKYSFWVFKVNSRTHEESTFDCQDLIGQIVNEMKEEFETLVIKRRVFSPYYTINLRDYSAELLTSIYYEIKYYYLQQVAYRAYDQEIEVASIFAFVSIFDPPVKKSSGMDPYTEFKIYVDNLDKYLEELFPKYFLQERDRKEIIRPLKNRLNERLARQQEKSPLILKRKIIDKFRDQPYFCATNYLLYSESHGADCLISINSMFICVQFDLTSHYIFLESIINMVPHERHLMLRYYDKDRGTVEELSFATREKQSMWVVMDFLSYCTIRIKTPNMFLYLQREMYAQLIRYSLPMSFFDYQVQMNTSIVTKKVSMAREELSQTVVQEIVDLFQRNLKRLEKLEIVVETEREYTFQKENLFVKTYINRLQYPYRVNRKLELSEPLGPKPKKSPANKDPNNKPENKPLAPFINVLEDPSEPQLSNEPILNEPQSATKPPPREPTPVAQPATVQKQAPPTPPPQPSTEPPMPDDGEVVINRQSRGARDSRNRNSRDRERDRRR